MYTVDTIYINQSAPSNLIMCTSYPIIGFSRKLMYPLNGIAIAQLPGYCSCMMSFWQFCTHLFDRNFFKRIYLIGIFSNNYISRVHKK
jgi:hypothetical protein